MEKRILLASPRGFCMGVARGVEMLGSALEKEKGTVYVRREIVHNVLLTEYFKTRGAVFVDELEEVPDGGTVVFSTHGVAPSVKSHAAQKNIKVIDATCPLVTKVHEQAVKFKNLNYEIILIGVPEHPEVVGTMAHAPDNIYLIRDERDFDKLSEIDGSRVAWLSQTTLNFDSVKKIIDRLRKKFPSLADPPQSCICHATKKRQAAVKEIAAECDLFIVVGSENSSNTLRLAEVALEAGAKKVLRIDTPEELESTDFSDVYIVGVTAGVSVTEEALTNVVGYLEQSGFNYTEESSSEK